MIDNIQKFVQQCEDKAQSQFALIDAVALKAQEKVLRAFLDNKVSARHFAPSTGYGYSDDSRDTLDKVFAIAFDAESAIVSPGLASGTHAISTALFGVLRPDDTMLSITGKPYDTLSGVLSGVDGALDSHRIKYAQVELRDNLPDLEAIDRAISKLRPKIVYLQRSRGYEWRQSLSIAEIGEAVAHIRRSGYDGCIMADNCYGEFVEATEPCAVGVDVVIGSLIKNPGGGLAPTGGYIAGAKRYIDPIAARLTCPGLGREIGSYAGDYRPFYQGLFLAPHTVAQALKGSILFGIAFDTLGYETLPKIDNTPLRDITRAIKFGDPDRLIAFCRAIQGISPVDGYVTLYPWDMPGYNDQVIMAAGSFVQGSSIELSADAPIRPPYIAYLQGGLTYEHVKLALIRCLEVIV